MHEEEPIKRFQKPTLDDLSPLLGGVVTAEVLDKVRAVICGEISPSDASPTCAAWLAKCYNKPAEHAQILYACDELLGGCGVEALTDEKYPSHTDDGTRMCPPLSYVNTGESYEVTLGRDHQRGAWVVCSWGDFCEEYERANEIGDYERFDSCPDECPACRRDMHQTDMRLSKLNSSDGYAWICGECNHYCLAVKDYKPIAKERQRLRYYEKKARKVRSVP